jgi:magnesium chelatase subunit I
MNPEEGDLRPQLLDRFGLCVHVLSLTDKTLRMEILKRKAAFDADSVSFAAHWDGEQKALSRKISNAKARLHSIHITDDVLEKIVNITSPLNLDGHRADIVIMKSAKALAAFRDKGSIDVSDIRDAAGLSLPHRMKRLPFEEIGQESEKLQAVLAEMQP